MPHPCEELKRLMTINQYDDPSMYKRSDGGNMAICLLAGALVVWAVLSVLRMTGNPSTPPPLYQSLPYEVIVASGRLAKRAVSARKTGMDVPEGLLSLSQCKSHLKFPVEGDLPVIVANCKDGDYKNMTEDDKGKVDEALRAYLARPDDMVLMVYADWCPHCHQQMPNYVAMSSQGTRAKFVVVHALACKDSSWSQQNPNKTHGLKYFPTFLVKKNDADGTPKLYEANMQEVLAFSRDGRLPASAAAEAADATASTGENDQGSTKNMLKQFF